MCIHIYLCTYICIYIRIYIYIQISQITQIHKRMNICVCIRLHSRNKPNGDVFAEPLRDESLRANSLSEILKCQLYRQFAQILEAS